MSETKAERRVREFVEKANEAGRPLMAKWARQEAEEVVENVFDGWAFDGPWTTEEYYRFRAEVEAAVLEAAPRIARCVDGAGGESTWKGEAIRLENENRQLVRYIKRVVAVVRRRVVLTPAERRRLNEAWKAADEAATVLSAPTDTP